MDALSVWQGTSLAPITTVWDWLNQVNASNFAGHNDWRLPSEYGRNLAINQPTNAWTPCVDPATNCQMETLYLLDLQ